MNDLERLLVGRLERASGSSANGDERARDASANDGRAATLRAVQAELYRPTLTGIERAAQRGLKEGTGDPLDGLLSLRIGAALAAGHATLTSHAATGANVSGSPDVLVLHKKSGTDRTRVDSQIAAALARVRDRLKGESVGDSTLLLLAHQTAFEKLRRFLPAAETSRIVFYTREETARGISEPRLRDVEVVEAEHELATLEQHLARLLKDAQGKATSHSQSAETIATGAMGAMGAAGAAGPPGASSALGVGGPRAAEETLTSDATVPLGGAALPGASAGADDDPLLGTLFHHKYRILRKIGIGGFGAVYEARDERGAGNRVAIKVLHTQLAANAALVRAFRSEARRMTRLSHPGIVDWKVFDETDEGTHYFVMELVEGVELDRVLASEGALPWRRVAEMMLQVLDALRAAHHLGESESVLHLDLKPRNVFVLPARAGRPETVKVIDFGIGQYIGEDEDDAVPPELRGDGPGDLSGAIEETFNPTTIRFAAIDEDKQRGFRRCTGCTPEYASPEQCAHVLEFPDIVPLDGRSDLYSLGAMGFQMLTAELPFSRPLVRTDFLRLHLERAPKKAGAMGVPVPRRFARFIDRCLEKNPDKRFRDTNEAYAELHRIVHPPVARRIVMAGVPLVLVAFAVGAVLNRDSARRPIVPLASGTQYFGPERPALELTPKEAEMLTGARSARLLSAAGEPLEGWSAELAGSGSVRIGRAGEFPLGRVEASARLQIEGSAYDFEPLALVWLGVDAWRLESVRVGGLDELGRLSVDPAGLELAVRVTGERVDDIASVRVDSEELERRRGVGGELVSTVQLDRFGLRDGEARELKVVVQDLAGRAFERAVPLDVVAAPLELGYFELRDGAGSSGATCSLLNAQYLVHKSTQPILHLEWNRKAAVVVTVSAEGAVPRKHVESDSLVHEIDLSELIASVANDRERFVGTIGIEATDAATVLHARASTNGTAARPPLPFVYDARKAEVNVRLAGGMLAPDTVRYVNKKRIDLELVLPHQAPVKVVVSSPEGAFGTVAETSLCSLVEDRAEVALDFAGDGEYRVVVAAYLCDSETELAADQPDAETTYTIVVATEAPELDLSEALPGTLTRFVEIPPFVPLRARPGAGGRVGVPVEASWSVESADGGTVAGGKLELVPGGDAVPADILGRWKEPAPPADGSYRLVLTGRDRAGNAARSTERGFVVSLTGPALTVQQPRTGGDWYADDGRWTVQVLAPDPNGTASVECTLEDASDATRSVPVALAASPTDPSVFRGSVALAEDWSRRSVVLRFRARDRLGSETSAVHPEDRGQPIQLAKIDPPTPQRVRAVDGRGELEPLRLVPGNRSAEYFFGGKNDAEENRRCEQFGLDPFSPSGSTRAEKSWRVNFPARAIGDFYLDEREVGVGQFLTFVKDPAGYAHAGHWPSGSRPDRSARGLELERRLSALDPELPVTDVFWEEASAYAAWAGKRLPSWVEWEYAVRGGDDYRPCASCVAEPAGALAEVLDAPRPRGSGSDVTPDTGIHDLTGNVAEWIANPSARRGRYGGHPDGASLLAPDALGLDEPAQEFWIVGGSYRDPGRSHFAKARDEPRTYTSPEVGFRCALSIDDVRAQLRSGALREVDR